MNFFHLFRTSRSFRIKLVGFSVFDWLNPELGQVVETLMQHPLVVGDNYDHQLPSHTPYFLSLEGPELVALGLFVDGEEFGTSSNLADFLTMGYGKLDGYGEWEFPLPERLVHQIEFLLSIKE